MNASSFEEMGSGFRSEISDFKSPYRGFNPIENKPRKRLWLRPRNDPPVIGPIRIHRDVPARRPAMFCRDDLSEKSSRVISVWTALPCLFRMFLRFKFALSVSEFPVIFIVSISDHLTESIVLK
jgi:hypothetical protein